MAFNLFASLGRKSTSPYYSLDEQTTIEETFEKLIFAKKEEKVILLKQNIWKKFKNQLLLEWTGANIETKTHNMTLTNFNDILEVPDSTREMCSEAWVLFMSEAKTHQVGKYQLNVQDTSASDSELTCVRKVQVKVTLL